MPAVALLLFLAQHDRRFEAVPGALPCLEATGHAGDVCVAHLGKRLGGEQRPDAAGAIEDHRGVTVGRGPFDLLFDVALRDVMGAGMKPCSHSDASRTSTIVAAPAGSASTSWAVTSRIWLRASRRRSA